MTRNQAFFPFFLERGFCCSTCALARESQRHRETESEKSPPEGMAMPLSLLLHSPLRILDTHIHTLGMSLKPLDLGLEPQLTMWESSNASITAVAGPEAELSIWRENLF